MAARRTRLGLIAVCAALVAPFLFLAGVALVGDELLTASDLRIDIALAIVFLSIACGLLAIAATIAWGVIAWRARAARPE
jgi:hypothetical protein